MAVDLQGNIIDEQGVKTGGTVDLNTGALTSASLTPSPTIDFQTPKPSPLDSVSGIEIPPSPIEQLNKFLAGETTFKAEQEDVLGVTEATQAIDDLSTRFKDLQRQELAIVPQTAQEMTGRASIGAISGETRARQRIVQIEALTVSSLIDAASNRLTSAQKKVERAITLKFGQAKAEKEALIQNLDLLIKSGSLTREEAKRAEAQKQKQEQEKAKLDQRQADYLTAQTAVVNLVSLNKGISSSIMEELRKAETPLQVAEIANKYNLDSGTVGSLPVSIKEYEYAVKKGGYKGTFTDYQNEDANRKKSIAAAQGTIPLTPEDKRDLIGVGFLPADITNIERDIAQYGIEAVVAQLKNSGSSKQQIAYVQKVYGVQQKVSREQITTTVTQKLAQDELKKIYTQEELEKLAKEAGFAGFFISRTKEVENYLNSDKAKQAYIDYLYSQYKAAGMAI